MRKGIIKKIANIITNILMVLVFIILIIIIGIKINMVISGKNYFNVKGYSVFCVVTGSMEPAIKKNDVIIVKRMDDYNVSDVITFEKEKDYITHRIVSINDKTVTTKGDANNALDVAIPYNKIIGKVIKIYPNAGLWQKILTTPSVIVMIFITLVLFDVAFSYKGNKKINDIIIDDQEKNKEKNIKIKEEKLKKQSKKKAKEEPAEELSIEEIDEIFDKMTEKKEKVKENSEKLDYTIRLDLKKLQEEINNKINKDE